MKLQSKYLQAFSIRTVQFLVAAFLCVTLVFSSTVSAFAATSQSTQGEVKLSEIEQETQEMTRKTTTPGLKETQAKTRKGINGVQGDANKSAMKKPDNSSGESVEEKIEEGLDNLFND
ncbi:MAG: low temperature-induced protein [Oscillatoriales cyanobacterium RM2_1_1]|nr:low temperature-induced protein [Oscillatoriales cyanobacterium SM2_3_0]NJO48004.1 low temperature-induced protein [Oscillatoriales cyanobacterium RM2_1_1]